MNLESIKKVHLIGVGGIGVSAIARLLLAQGKNVSGSDLVKSEIVEPLIKNGLIFYARHKISNIPTGVELVVYSPAVLENNPERIKAKKLNIPQLSYPEFLGLLSKEKFTITVSGTDGKSTTTALCGLIFAEAGIDPTVIVGSKVKKFDENLRIGHSPYLILEGCEYRANMLNLSPQIIVLTNIVADHLDYYKNLGNIIKAFQKYVSGLPEEGELILNADDENCVLVGQSARCKVTTYGINKKADLIARKIIVKNTQSSSAKASVDRSAGKQFFELVYNGESLGTFSLAVPGKFNIYNALAAVRLALTFEISIEITKKTLADFGGIWRRFENVGQAKNGATIISDYAHTPEAVNGTLKAAKEFYPAKKIIAVFQPHHRHRTKVLFDKFVKSFSSADVVILPEIYDVAGREKSQDKNISSKDLAKAIGFQDKKKEIYFVENLDETAKLVQRISDKNCLILLMGAGDIYKVAKMIKN